MSPRKYAEGTQVPVNRSRDEIEHTLTRFGATGQAWMRDDERGIVTVGFKRGGIVYRFTIAQPPLSDFATTSSGRWRRTPEQQKDEQEAEVKRRFRSLANYVKALMDAVDTGIIKAEEALLPYRLLPSGETVFERAAWQLQAGQEMDLVKALPSGRPKA